jgi:hypothetical protein
VGIVVIMFWFMVQLICLILIIIYIVGYIMDYAYRD